MKTPIRGALVCAFLITGTMAIRAQGSLTPPGAPAPTMKSLAQIEPRTPISAAPFTISASGSYYLTKNLSVTTGDAITITTDNVTLDLNGFTISSTAASPTGTAILLGGSGNFRSNIFIFNGRIASGVTQSGGIFSGGGFNAGVDCSLASQGVRVRDVAVIGVMANGITLSIDGYTRIESCTVYTAGGGGMIATSVSSCIVDSVGSAGINANTADDCFALSFHAYGIIAGTVTNCYGRTIDGDATVAGIYGTTMTNCLGISNHDAAGIKGSALQNCSGSSFGNGPGISADVVTNSHGDSVGGYGIYAGYGATNCLGTSTSNTGLVTGSAHNCWGKTTTGPAGLNATTANGCVGWQTDNTGDAINAKIAVACETFGGVITAPQKFLGTP